MKYAETVGKLPQISLPNCGVRCEFSIQTHHNTMVVFVEITQDTQNNGDAFTYGDRISECPLLTCRLQPFAVLSQVPSSTSVAF